MTKQYFILFTFAFLLTGCKSQQPTQSANADCVGFFSFVSRNWQYDKEHNYYVRSKEMLGNFSGEFSEQHFEKCLLSLDTTQLKKVFGTPSKKVGNSFLYLVQPIGKELSYQFAYNSEGIITNYLIIMQPVDNGF